mmetsp:Transcript_50205/g.160895  ORF Transcript_50205/g.160895 Transcript_50205/m.160895 type:complete len:307 (+) Transcript_50205:1668-2588(+)
MTRSPTPSGPAAPTAVRGTTTPARAGGSPGASTSLPKGPDDPANSGLPFSTLNAIESDVETKGSSPGTSNSSWVRPTSAPVVDAFTARRAAAAAAARSAPGNEASNAAAPPTLPKAPSAAAAPAGVRGARPGGEREKSAGATCRATMPRSRSRAVACMPAFTSSGRETSALKVPALRARESEVVRLRRKAAAAWTSSRARKAAFAPTPTGSSCRICRPVSPGTPKSPPSELRRPARASTSCKAPSRSPSSRLPSTSATSSADEPGGGGVTTTSTCPTAFFVSAPSASRRKSPTSTLKAPASSPAGR